MGRGKRWTDAENTLLLEMVSEGLTPREIFESGKFPERTQDSIRVQIQRLGGSSFVQTKHTAIVQTIEPAPDALSIEHIVKLFSTAFRQICELDEVDRLTLERFRIIFQAAKDYPTLLKTYEKWEEIEKRIDQLEADIQPLVEMKKKEKASPCQTPP